MSAPARRRGRSCGLRLIARLGELLGRWQAASLRGRHSRRGLITVLVVGAACSPGQPADDVPLSLERTGRFGSLRDFVLFERTIDGQPFVLFLDRFEATRADWREFAATAAGRTVAAGRVPVVGDLALPVGNVDLQQARAFAAWRLARLPRAREWFTCVMGDGRNRFPWGSKEDPTRTNTGELGLGEPTPVGTFESGRRSEGNQPYDLIGNVSEWTETVPASWCLSDRSGDPLGGVLDPGASFAAACERVRSLPALTVWGGVGGLVAPMWAAALAGADAPHEVVGADFQSPMAATSETVLAGDRRTRTGVRLCTTPRELLEAMLACRDELDAVDRALLRRFLSRPEHRSALLAAWPPFAAQAARREGSLAGILLAEFGAAAPTKGH